MNGIIPFYKRRGERLSQTLSRLREERPELRDQTLSYAGRLDPLAEGLLLVLAGEANKERKKYLSLPKTYRFDVLFGWSTDTYDIAGKLVETSNTEISMMDLMGEIQNLPGTYTKPYPPYSSKPVDGKPLFWWARNEKLDEITIPTHKVTVHSALLLKTGKITGPELDSYVHESIALLKGDFRQEEIRACWEENLKNTYLNTYDTATIEINCGSGTYVRSIAHELGEKLGVPALALSILRTRVGDFKSA